MQLYTRLVPHLGVSQPESYFIIVITVSVEHRILEKLTLVVLVKKFLAFYGFRTFTTVFTEPRLLPFSYPVSLAATSILFFVFIVINDIIIIFGLFGAFLKNSKTTSITAPELLMWFSGKVKIKLSLCLTN
jgi:hypothetical protein